MTRIAVFLFVLMFGAADALAQAKAPGKAPAKASAKTPAKASAKAPGFDAIVKEADEARQQKRLDDAVALYRKALAIDRRWTEGRWYLGTTLYELDRFAEARDAFRAVVLANDTQGAAWALKGLCEYRLKNYETALADLIKARTHGIGDNQEINEVASYHTAVLSTRIEQYEQALRVLADFALTGNDAPRVIEAMGIATLRMPMLPEELPGEKRELVMMAGRARYFMSARMMAAAQAAFEALVTRFPDTPNVHYARGVFLLAEQQEAAIEAFTRELKQQPHHVWSKLQIAFVHIRRGDFAAARPFAEAAATEAPTLSVSHNALGQVLLEAGDTEGAIREFQTGVKLSPDNPAMRFVLARAYRRAGRAKDADREQAEFTRLDRLARAARMGSHAVGGIELDPAPAPDRQP
jgi:tetratricopeptide (TPR) repeat protein